MAARQGRVFVYIGVEHADPAGGFIDQRTDNADRGGFTGTVGPEQGKKITRADFEIHAAQRLGTIVIGFVQIFYF